MDRRSGVRIVLLAAAILLLLVGIVGGTGRAKAAVNPTIVSLTFDDGDATEAQLRPMLSSHGMHATFYLNSQRLGSSDYYMNWSQIAGLAADGNEIAGHTADHVNLPLTDPTEAQRQICNDRVNLFNHGYQPTNFAYPFGAFNSTIKGYVAACGYNSARSTNDFGPNCNNPCSESIPPADVYATRVAASGGTLSSLESAVTKAEQHGGGWVQVLFHQICSGCSPNGTPASTISAFLDWLQPRAANGTVVQTVQQVIGGPVQPPVSGPPAPPPPNGANGLRNASLETDADGDLVPDCWWADTFGNNTTTFTRTSDAHTGTRAEKIDVSNYQDGDSKLMVAQDQGFCTPSVAPGHRYQLKAWYKSTAPAYFTLFTRDNSGSFAFWTSSPTFPASPDWTQVTWNTPVIADGVAGLSFGFGLGSNGSFTVDDLSMDDAASSGGGDPTPPTVNITSPPDGSTVSGPVTIAANASDNIGVDHVDFLVDGNVVSSQTLAPYSYAWDSRSVANGPHEIGVRAYDTSNNSTTATENVTVENLNVNLLQNPSLEAAGANGVPTCWLLGGFGNNTFAWTRTSDAHTGSFAEKLDITAWTDGDRKIVSAQDTGACAPVAVPGHTYTITNWYKSSSGTPVMYVYYRSSAGVWTYWTQHVVPASSDWTQATFNTPVLPAGATAISVGMGLNNLGSLTMDDFTLYDNPPPNGADHTPPTVSLTSPSDGTTVSGPVTISATAADNVAVGHIDLLVDGNVVATQNGGSATYAWDSRSVGNGPHTLTANAYDTSNNTATASETVTVDNSTVNLLQNPSLETAGTNGVPTCWLLAGSGTNTFAWTRTSDAHTGSFAEQLDMTAWTNGDRKMVSAQDTGACAPSATAGHTYTISNWYKSSSGAPTVFVYYRSSAGVWTYWVQHAFSTASDWTQATWTTPALPAGATAISIGMGLSNVGSVTMDDFALYDNPPPFDPNSPVSTIACNPGSDAGSQCVDSWYPAPVHITMSATDTGGSGLSQIVYTTDGSDPSLANGTTYAGPFSLASTTTVKYRAYDNAGNAEAIHSQLIHIDGAAPNVTLNSPADGASVDGTITLDASASDDVSVDHVDFLVDGQVVGTVAGAPYQTAYDTASLVNGVHTFAARATDEVGHQTSSTTANVTVAHPAPPDTLPPASTISCNGGVCQGLYSGAVTVSLSAVDDPGGSGVAQIVYTTDGSDPSFSNGTVYSGAFVVPATTTVKYRAYDVAGNAEAVNSQTILVDTAAPSSSIACNGGACQGGFYGAAVSVTLSASDGGGSGVSQIRYTTDGTDPTATTGTVYSGAFNVTATATVRYRAFDNIGNAEAVNSQLIQIDTAAPSSSIACNGGACQSGFYGAAVSVTLSATDGGGSGVSQIVYTTDGSDPSTTNGMVYSGAFSVAATTTVKYRAFDNAGNAEAIKTQAVQIDTVAPATTISCNAAACLTGWYTAGVTVTLAAADTGGSGVGQIRYTTNGTDPTATTGTVYSGAFNVTATATVKYRAFDNVGNAEAVNSQLIRIDTVAPTATIACNGAACAAWYHAPVSVTLAATDNNGGSGVAQIRYTTDGTNPTLTTGIAYTDPFTISATTSIRYRAWDVAGNASAVKTQQISIDTIAPTVSILAPLNGSLVTGNVTITTLAVDAGGSGLSGVSFYVDGTLLSTDKSSPYTANWNTKQYAKGQHTLTAVAVDNAGNSTTSAPITVTVF